MAEGDEAPPGAPVLPEPEPPGIFISAEPLPWPGLPPGDDVVAVRVHHGPPRDILRVHGSTGEVELGDPLGPEDVVATLRAHQEALTASLGRREEQARNLAWAFEALRACPASQGPELNRMVRDRAVGIFDQFVEDACGRRFNDWMHFITFAFSEIARLGREVEELRAELASRRGQS